MFTERCAKFFSNDVRLDGVKVTVDDHLIEARDWHTSDLKHKVKVTTQVQTNKLSLAHTETGNQQHYRNNRVNKQTNKQTHTHLLHHDLMKLIFEILRHHAVDVTDAYAARLAAPPTLRLP